MNNTNHDIAIIGGGPAGSSAAIRLARLGFDVCLVEKNAFPRNVLCGEFLSEEVSKCLTELNLFEKFISLKPNKISSLRMIDKNGNSVQSNLNFKAYGLNRSLFDEMLLKAAEESGASVYQPARVSSIVKNGEGFVLKIKTDKESFEINVKNIIGAYGKFNKLDWSLNRKFVNSKSGFNAIKYHLSEEQCPAGLDHEIVIYASDKIYCGINKIDGGLTTVCLLERTREFDEPINKRMINLIDRNPYFRSLFNKVDDLNFEAVGSYGTANIFFGRRELVKDGIFMIGDSAGVIAPLAGDGIGMAVESAKIIAETFFKIRRSELNMQEAADYYQQRWQFSFKKRMRSAAMIQKIIMNSSIRRIGFRLANTYPAIMHNAIKLTRGMN